MQEPEAKPKEPEVRGIQRQDYLDWRQHPVTGLFRRYLSDYRADLRRGAIERWEDGSLNLGTEKEIKSRLNVLEELADLPFEAIVEFYRQTDELNEAE